MKIHSIRFKITAITVGVILATVLSIIGSCYSTIQKESDRNSVEMMRLVGKDTQNTLDEYFVSIERAVGTAGNEAIDTLDSVVLVECGAVGSRAGQEEKTDEQVARLDAYLAEYCGRIQDAFESVASHTHGIITYYYCLNPKLSETEHGFYYSRVGRAGFVEQEPLDVRAFMDEDREWYDSTVQRGRPAWIGPYSVSFIANTQICSYLMPIYSAGTLVGVLGMDIPLNTLIDQVSPIRVYDTGYACLCDSEGHIYYHPEMEAGSVPKLSGLTVSRGLLTEKDSGSQLIRYVSNGVKRQMCFSTLRNGMKLVVSAPVREINSSWLRMIRVVLIVTVVTIAVYAVMLMFAMGLLTRPLKLLTSASRRLAAADYDVELNYKSRDEVGELTEAFRVMRDKQKTFIEDLNRRIYTDDLTDLPNMRCFFHLAEQNLLDFDREGKHPALLYFNLIGMKHFNRQYGFEEGNKLICAFGDILERHYGRDHICRIAQDHFAAMTDEDGLEKELHTVFYECQNANGGRSLPIRVGIYRCSLERVGVSVACDRAKYACDLRRGTFYSGFSYFREEMQKQAENLRYVINHLDQALEERWIHVYYQPLIRAVNGKVCDEEALSRWADPDRGLLSPADFIPALEDSGLIYKLDLYVLDRILEKLWMQREAGYTVVPCSVNLSRSDFDACDIVEEIRERVDAAGISRDLITIEITESIIGSNFNFMKEQVARFQKLGFSVWMDDFGSGYSSLDVLQSIKFNLIKFDMSFMRKLDESEDGRIILTKLMEMATAIGVDTVCEGVETEEQKQFLQEIGCSKLQGYYFSKPLPQEEIMERNRKGTMIGYENPDESAYYESVGRVNLYDLDVIAADEGDAFRGAFNRLPMCIIEIVGDSACLMRSNPSYRDFVERYYGIDLAAPEMLTARHNVSFIDNVVKTCRENGTRSFYDETLPDGSQVHFFARRVGVNPVSGNIAVVAAVLSITEPDADTTYAEIAGALAADYYNIYVIDLDTELFTEYKSSVGGDELMVERRDEQFFAAVRRDVETRIYEEDRETFLAEFSKEDIIRELDEQGVYTTTYRLIDTGTPMYVNMKITRMPGGNRIIMGISVIDSQMKQKKRQEEIKKERDAMVRVMALQDGYMSLYTVDLATGSYVEFSATDDYESLGVAKEGDDFFGESIRNSETAISAEDRPAFFARFNKENILHELQTNGSFQLAYHLMIGGEQKPVILRIAQFKESGEEKLLVGVRTWRERGSETRQ